ncbi:MAG: SBBP repeat-containing protein [Bacteroidota bacterium]|nr:SBBP repeat-containing protein [Bacteroidota bacterium]
MIIDKRKKMKAGKILLLLLMLISLVDEMNSQVQLEWVARYNGPSNFSEYVSAMTIDSMGNIYVTGEDNEQPYGFVTVKFNSSGQFVWARRYSGGLAIKATPKSIAVDLQGNVYVGASDVDYIVVKYDVDGVEQWVKKYRGSGTGMNEIVDLVIDYTENVNVLVTGSSDNIISTRDIGTLKYSTNGDTLWTRNFSRLNNTLEWATAMDIDNFNALSIAGDTKLSMQSKDFLTLSYDYYGNLRWAQTFDGPASRWDEASDIASDKNGNVYVTGYATMDSLNAINIATIKYNSSGNEQWVRFYEGTFPYYYSEGRFIKIDPYYNIVTAGWQAGYNYDFCTIKYDSLGNQLWVKGYNGAANAEDFLEGLAVDKYGDIYVTGSAKDEINRPKITTIKYDKGGNQVWLQKYPDSDSISYPKGIIVDKDLNVYVAGISFNPSDIIVLKYSQPTSVVPILSEVPDGFQLYQNYPNPFNSKTNIKYQITNSSFLRIKVYDVFGREVATLVNEKKEPGEYQVEWDAEGLASGLYYYRIISGRYIETKKALLIK